MENGKRKMENDAAFILPNILFIMMFLTVILFGLVDLSNSVLYRARSRVFQLQALYAAESGADAALSMLNNSSSSYSGTSSPVTILTAAQDKATFTNTVSAGSDSNSMVIMSTGNVYVPKTAATPAYTRTVRVIAKRSSTTSSSALVSRNILDIASSVKSVTAVDIYVNGYINMAKNTNQLIAENITVGGRNTGANNCSIGGSGSLVKPATFTHTGQTKTNITTEYNNCISPPGNASNSDFNVSANSNVDQIVSTFVPWGQFMDSSYQNAGTCDDWTASGTTLTIPSVPKATHYPDSGSNVSTSCGTNGDIDLGSKQINISDNVHLRANLCQANACNPTFNNTTSNLVWIFVEGDVNFASVQTASGSGPIVLVSYGSDPSSLSTACPDGGAVHVGSNGSTTSAPALFLLASNGLCLERTKFGSGQSLAGVSGKNLYIATNSGTPFDLAFNPSFPVNQIPTNLAWRAVLYQQTNPPN